MKGSELEKVGAAVWREMSRSGGEWDRKRVADLAFDLDLTEIPVRLVGARLILEHLAGEYPDLIQKLPDRLFTYKVVQAPNIVKVIVSRDLLERTQRKLGLEPEAAVTVVLKAYLKRFDV